MTAVKRILLSAALVAVTATGAINAATTPAAAIDFDRRCFGPTAPECFRQKLAAIAKDPLAACGNSCRQKCNNEPGCVAQWAGTNAATIRAYAAADAEMRKRMSPASAVAKPTAAPGLR